MMLAFVVVSVLGGLALLAALSLADQHRGEGWERLRLAAASNALRDLQSQYAVERTAADAAYARADASRARGDVDEAVRLMNVGYEYLSELAQDRRAYLSEMALYCRLVSAIVPLPPLRPGQFQLAELRHLAGIGGVVHYLLVAAVERFRLRLWLLGRGFALVVRALVPRSERVPAARSDFRTLEDETVRSAEALVEALAVARLAERKVGA
jgi:hypothetical protein